MKRLVLVSLTILLSLPIFAQVISPDSMMTANVDIREKLVTLALQNPDLEIADHQIKIARYNLKAAKGWWAENLSFSFNANEYSIKQFSKHSNTSTPYNFGLFPLYNMGINIPIGGIFSKPEAVKTAREQVMITQIERTAKERQIRATVLTAYENYLSGKELYTVESQLTESAYNDYLQAKEKFRNGQISVTDYNASINQYQSTLKSKISAENSFNITQIQLEELIGVPIGQVLDNMETPSAKDSGSPAFKMGKHSR